MDVRGDAGLAAGRTSPSDCTRHLAIFECEDAKKWEGYTESLWKEALHEPGDCWTVFKACEGELPTPAEAAAYDAIVIGGSHYSAYEEHEWITKMLELLPQYAAQGARMYGCCFGSQILARALGGTVGKNPDGNFVLTLEQIQPTAELQQIKELHTVVQQALQDACKVAGSSNSSNNSYTQSTAVPPTAAADPGQGSGLAAVASAVNAVADGFQELQLSCSSGCFRLIESHGDQVLTLPPDAIRLATSPTAANELWCFGPNVLASQFHVEFDEPLVLDKIWKSLKEVGRLDDQQAEESRRIIEAGGQQNANMLQVIKYFLKHGIPGVKPVITDLGTGGGSSSNRDGNNDSSSRGGQIYSSPSSSSSSSSSDNGDPGNGGNNNSSSSSNSNNAPDNSSSSSSADAIGQQQHQQVRHSAQAISGNPSAAAAGGGEAEAAQDGSAAAAAQDPVDTAANPTSTTSSVSGPTTATVTALSDPAAADPADHAELQQVSSSSSSPGRSGLRPIAVQIQTAASLSAAGCADGDHFSATPSVNQSVNPSGASSPTAMSEYSVATATSTSSAVPFSHIAYQRRQQEREEGLAESSQRLIEDASAAFDLRMQCYNADLQTLQQLNEAAADQYSSTAEIATALCQFVTDLDTRQAAVREALAALPQLDRQLKLLEHAVGQLDKRSKDLEARLGLGRSSAYDYLASTFGRAGSGAAAAAAAYAAGGGGCLGSPTAVKE